MSDYVWTAELEEQCKKIIDQNSDKMDQKTLDKFLEAQDKNWEKFYKFNKTNFFKDRHYILREFEELKADNRVSNKCKQGQETIVFLDIGCGVGNSFYPLLTKKDNLIVKGFDISKRAVTMAAVTI